jgi:hypothetical protein
LFGLIQISKFIRIFVAVAVNMIIFVDNENISFEAGPVT